MSKAAIGARGIRKGVNIKVIQNIRAKSIGEAIEKTRGGAGKTELDWVLANPRLARRIITGKGYFFFPGASEGNLVPCVHWRNGQFWEGYQDPAHGWFRYSGRIVVGKLVAGVARS